MLRPTDPSHSLPHSSPAEPVEMRKPWVTPALKVLPVPSHTRGGFFLSDHEDIFYKTS